MKTVVKKTAKKAVKATRLEQLEEGLQSVKDWQASMITLRTWEVSPDGNRRMFFQSHEEYCKKKDAS